MITSIGKKVFSVDETLRSPRPAFGPDAAGAGRQGRRSPGGWFRDMGEKLRSIPRPDFVSRRSALDPVVYFLAALSIGAAAVMGTLYTPSYVVSVDGVVLGAMDSRDTMEQVIDRVEARATSILGYDYRLEQDVGYEFKLSPRDTLMADATAETYLFDQIGEVMKSAVLTVNGQVIGSTDSSDSISAMLEAIKAPYINENTVSAEFVQPVVVSREYMPTSAQRDLESMRAVLTGNSMEQVQYTVQAGETFSEIANGHGMTVAELQAINPGVDINKLMVGQGLTISQAVPYLSVKTVDRVSYQAPVAYETQQVSDDTMYQGDTKVLSTGVDGLANVNADVTYVNGTEQSRAVNSSEVVAQPVTQVEAVGTKERPRTMATGSLNWPIYGHINSGYGSRYIFGSYSFHSGIDISGSYGQAIAAADGGKVIFAGTGTGSNWSYGKYVVIDHENGIQTYYAHCSSLNVSVGDRVYQGQTIARVGSTGRSTGNHCHFQVKVNGETVSPYTYLP